MVQCQCVGVTDVTIKRLIEEGASSVGEITRRCGAGRCCVPCRQEIAALLYCRRCSQAEASVGDAPPTSPDHAQALCEGSPEELPRHQGENWP